MARTLVDTYPKRSPDDKTTVVRTIQLPSYLEKEFQTKLLLKLDPVSVSVPMELVSQIDTWVTLNLPAYKEFHMYEDHDTGLYTFEVYF